MDLPKSAQEKIQKLQLYEQKINALVLQKQEFESQVAEILSASQAIGESKDKESYKIIGNVMILSENSKLKEDLEANKKKAEMRIKSLEKQETELKTVAEAIQKEVLKQMEGKK